MNEKELVIMLKMNEKAPSRISDDYHPVKTEKQTFKSEVAKMKSLGLKGGLQYFWMYYKIPVLIIVLVIVCGISMSMADRKSTRLNSSHVSISYAVFCLKKKIARHHVE